MPLEEGELFYFCSLSAATVVYKGQLISTQIPEFYPDLATRRSRPRSRWCISGFRPTPFRAGTARIRTASVAQRRDQHAARQYQLDARARRACSRSPLFGDDLEEAAADHRGSRQRLLHVRQLPGIAGAHRALAAARRDDDDSGGVAERRADDAGRQARVLRISLVPDGAVGRPGLDHVHRRHGVSARCSIATGCGPRVIT